MEAAGLGIGIAGLAGLFGACLEAIDKVKAYKSFMADADALDVQYDAHRVRLEHWGRSVGLADGQLSADHHQRLDDNHTRSSVADLLRIINKIFGSDGGSKQTGRGLTSLLKNDTLSAAVDQPRTRQGVAESKTRKLTWALGGKGDRTVQVRLLGDLVQQLHYLVPPERADRTHATPDISSRGNSRGTDPLSKVQTPGTQSELGWLAEFRQALAQVQAETRREVHAWVQGQHSPNERYEDSRNKRLSGTCDWILTRPAFTSWSASEPPTGTPEILWINGRPGFGKTILCSRIVEHLSAIPDKFVAHFFLSSDHESRNDPYAVARSWLSQLASQPDVYDLIRQRWETTQDQAATRATVIQLLRDALKARPGCYLVVDGLDECTAPADSSSSVARFLEDVKNAITPATRVLVISRDEPEIRQTLRAGDPDRLTEYQLAPGDVYDDATAFSRSIVDRKLPNKSDDIRESLSKTMSDRSDGQFLWLLLQEQSLKSWKNLAQLQRGLDVAPAGLDSLCERNWNRITRRDRADRAVALLRWAAFALRPLTVAEITEAVLIDEDDEVLPTDDLPDVIDDDYISSEILELCGPLVEVRGPHPAAGNQTVHLAHFTVREFLVKWLPAGGIRQNETLRASNEHIQNTILARLCLWYIQSRQAWQDNAAVTESPSQAVLRDYTAASWHAHLKSGVPLDHDPSTLECVLGFMDEEPAGMLGEAG